MDKFYINPKTNRIIKKGSKKFKELKDKGVKLKRSPCLFNEKSAKKCIDKIIKYYPNLPKTFKTLNNNITVIRNKDNLVHGVIAENGKMYKLEYPINVEKKVPELITVSDKHNDILNNKLRTADILNTDYIEKKLDNVTSGENIMYNPLRDNYTNVVSKQILKEINKEIPDILPNTNGVAGIIRNKDNLDEITGYINEKNEAIKLNTTLTVKVSELQKNLNMKNNEIDDLKNEIQNKLNSGELNKLNSLLILKENEKQQISKQCTLKITELYKDIGKLNIKIPNLEESNKYYYTLIKQTLEKWNPIEDDPNKYKSYATWFKDIFVGDRVLKKTDDIENNLNVLVERANMYANSKRSNIELLKSINEYSNINEKLNEQLSEYPYQKMIIDKLTRDLRLTTKQYQNSIITRDVLIGSYEKSIKGYIDAIQSLKDTNVNIGAEMGMLKNKYNDIKELQEQLKNNKNPDSEYNFFTKYFNVSQDYSILENLIEKHEITSKELQDKNINLEQDIINLQKKLKDTSNVNNLNIYKKAFKEIQLKYNKLIQENNDNLNKIIKLNTESETLSNIQSELYKCQQDKIRKENELNDNLSMYNSISLPVSVTDTFKSENKELLKNECSGYLTNEIGVKYILRWNDDVNKCYQEEIKCNDGELYNDNDNHNKCYPCEDYDLMWDPISNKCIKQSINILVDNNDNIIGESDVDNFTQVVRKNKKWY